MKKYFLLLTALLLSLSSCNSEEPVPKIKELASHHSVLAFGDSLTVGQGASVEQSYPKQLEKLINRRVIRAGVAGEVSAAGLKRIDAELRRYRPALMILCHGGNDILRRENPQRTYSNLKKMIQVAKNRGVDVVLIGVPTFSLMLSAPTPASYYDQLASEHNLPYERLTLSELLHDNQYKSDSIHLNAQGYKKLAEAIAKLLKKAGAV